MAENYDDETAQRLTAKYILARSARETFEAVEKPLEEHVEYTEAIIEAVRVFTAMQPIHAARAWYTLSRAHQAAMERANAAEKRAKAIQRDLGFQTAVSAVLLFASVALAALSLLGGR